MNPYALSGLASFWELVREIPPWRFLPLQWDIDLLEYPSKLFLIRTGGLDTTLDYQGAGASRRPLWGVSYIQ